jgi:hypothetical protein
MTKNRSLWSMGAVLSLLLAGGWFVPAPAHSAASTAANTPCCPEGECCPDCLPVAKTPDKAKKEYVCPPCPFCPGW